jgi:hypothetical protein
MYRPAALNLKINCKNGITGRKTCVCVWRYVLWSHFTLGLAATVFISATSDYIPMQFWKDVAKFESGRDVRGKKPETQLLPFSCQPHLTR